MGAAGWVVIGVVAVGALFAVLGWDRYRSNRRKASKSAQPTGEVFMDPSTGKPVRVWYNPSTGEREYRPE